jgi:peptidoglycan-associated lipoprotein
MKAASLKASIVLAFLLFCTELSAQRNYVKEANKAFVQQDYFKAIELYKKAYSKSNIKKKEDKAHLLFQLAECYRNINDPKQAEVFYLKAIKGNYSDPKAILYLADAKLAQKKYEEALAEYNNYRKIEPSDPRGEEGVRACEATLSGKD